MFAAVHSFLARASLPALIISALLISPNASIGVFLPSPAVLAQSISTPDPTLLPVATTLQVPLTAAYNALNILAKPVGGWYLDPTTQVKIYKLTSATFPTSSPNWGHDYAEGGDEVSLPYSGTTRAVFVRQNGGPWWLVDFTPGVGVSNPRPLTGNLSPFMDVAFTFSNNPATPYYAFVSTGSTIYRFDIRTMTEAPGNGWPVTGETDATWLHQSANDAFFVWMRGANGSTVVGYEPGTGTKKTYTNANLNEPRIDRAGRYVGITMNTPSNGLVVWDWQTNTVLWSTSGDPGIPFAHVASLKRQWLGVDWNMSYPPDFSRFIADVPNSASHIGGPANGGLIYGNGNWIQNPPDLNDQWALFHHYGSLRPAESYWLAPGGMLLITANGQRRLLGHPYNTAGNYAFYSFAKLSPDGNYVLFTSDMDGSGRSDVFLAELPTSGSADTTPPTVALTAPANGATVSGAAVPVAASASDNVGVVGVQFKLDGANLGAEDTAAPFAISWNTTAASNGPHSLTAVARDAAGYTATSTGAGVTVANVDTTPPLLSSITVSSIASTSAAITWTTNEPSGSQVEYGLTTTYGTLTALDPTLMTAHVQTLSGLTPGTLYHYRVRSKDAAGNLAVSADFTLTTVASPSPPAADVLVYRTPTPITVDGVLTEWSGAPSVQFSGLSNNATAYLSWDATNLYVAFQVTDTQLSATRTTRDGPDVYLDDSVEIYLDTLLDRATTMQPDDYQFLVNLKNTQADFRGTGTGKDASWNGTWLSAVGLQGTLNVSGDTDSGYVVEIAIPWAQIGVTPLSGMMLGIDLGVNDSDPSSATSFNYFDWAGIAPASYAHPNLWKQIQLVDTALNATTPPTVAVTAPTSGAAVSGTITVSATAADNVGVAGVQFKLDGTNLGVEVTTPPYAISWNTTATANGSHTLTAVARDAAGNTATSSPVTVIVSNGTTSPVISSVTASSITLSGAIITWTTNEPADSQVEYGKTTRYGSATPLDTSLVTAHSVTLSGLAARTRYHYRVKSKDAAGNLAVSADFTFKSTASANIIPPVTMTAPLTRITISEAVTASPSLLSGLVGGVVSSGLCCGGSALVAALSWRISAGIT